MKKIQDAAHRSGGCPYGVGLWNTPYLRRIYAPSRIRELRMMKKRMDPAGIMNPGKVYRPPLMLNPVSFSLGMEVFAFIRRIFGRRW